MIRIAAVGDIHLGAESRGTLRPHLEHLSDRADVLLLAGDLTRHGTAAEAQVVADEVGDLGVPVVAVLGNHDHHADEPNKVIGALEAGGVVVLEGSGVVLDVDGRRLGIAGTKGFGGGFPGACGSDFGEPEMKAFMRHSQHLACTLQEALEGLDADRRVALTHFAPVDATLRGERLEIYPFLGCYYLAEAIDAAGADLAVHGHAHAGTEHGVTPGGVQVRNVAQPVIQRSYRLYCLEGDGLECDDPAGVRATTG